VVAAGVVAAHNNALRVWLRSGGEGDPAVGVDAALEYVRRAWEAPGGTVAEPAPGAGEDVVVLVARRGTPMWRVVQGVEGALDRAGAAGEG
jgi:hypothetical protein